MRKPFLYCLSASSVAVAAALLVLSYRLDWDTVVALQSLGWFCVGGGWALVGQKNGLDKGAKQD